MRGKNYEDYVRHAEALKDLGQDSIWLERDGGDLPWAHATSCRATGSVRNGVPINFEIVAEHPCGLRFRWFEEVEAREANGSAAIEYSVDGCRRIAEALPAKPRKQFAEALRAVVAEMSLRITEQDRWLAKCRRRANDLAVVVAEVTS